MRHRTRLSLALTLALLGAGCAVGPDYRRPDAPLAAQFKEAQGWQAARPQDQLERGKWWEMFGDAQLNALQEQLQISNQTIRAAQARYRQASALVRQARSSFLPTIGASAQTTRSSFGGGSAASANADTSRQIGQRYSAGLNASWELDVWGRIRRDVEASAAAAQASEADLAAARLSAQAELALNYFQLRISEAQQRLYEKTVADYEKSLELTRNQYAVGVAGRSDVVQAEAQLKAAQAQAVDIGVQRAQLEHAIAVLIGKAPAELALDYSEPPAGLPIVPPGLPSDLLQRRPDIASAERQVAAANARIGVARSAYFPSLTLSGSGGYQSNAFDHWFTAPNRFWSVGPELALTLFDFGARRAQSEQAVAAYDETVANYRQTVLSGLQEVEDNLAALRLQSQEMEFQEAAVRSAREALTLVNNQYKAGTVSFLNVLTAENTALTNERALLQLRGQQFSASVNLIKALGGSWDGQLAAP